MAHGVVIEMPPPAFTEEQLSTDFDLCDPVVIAQLAAARVNRLQSGALPALSAQQTAVLQSALRKNRPALFITGAAGTGKSVVRRAMEVAVAAKPGETLYTTGPTHQSLMGVESRYCTLRRLMGSMITTGACNELVTESIQKSMSRVFGEKHTPTYLVVEEASMLSRDCLDLMDAALRRRTGINSPFGGVRLVLFGDVNQADPIDEGTGVFHQAAVFYNPSLAQPYYGLEVAELQQQFRQVGDKNAVFREMLREWSTGTLSDEAQRYWVSRVQPRVAGVPTLRHRVKDVDRHNAEHVHSLARKTKRQRIRYVSIDRKQKKTDKRRSAMEAFMLQTEVTLIKGCFVALTTNSFGAESGLANNTAGKVVGFKRILLAGGYVNLPEVLFDGFTRPYVVPWIVETVKRDGVLTKRAGLPLRLNHSVTIHKMQGCTTRHRIHAEVHNIQSCLGYVALSRSSDGDLVTIEAMPALGPNGEIEPRHTNAVADKARLDFLAFIAATNQS